MAGESSSHQGVHDPAAVDGGGGGGGRWYLLRKEIEENSPSRKDGIDLKKETYFRKSYCTFLQDLGMRLKVPQVTIATAIIFCHRFFLRQSHAKNDRRTIATVCMFLAGKVEETPRPIKDVILVSYEIIHKKDPAAAQRIKQKEVFEQQKELIVLGERVVLATLGFDLNVHHPYKPLVEAIKKFKVAQNALAQVAWNFVNDGLRTSLCLQFKPHHIAAGAIFLAAKFLKVKLPSDGEKVWWQEFDVTPRQLEEVSNQMLELYEQNKVPPSQASEAEGSSATQRTPLKGPAASEDHVANNGNSQRGDGNSRAGTLKPASSRPAHEQSHGENHGAPPRSNQSRNDDYGNTEMCNNSDPRDGETNGNQHLEREASRHHGSTSRYSSEGNGDDQEGNVSRPGTRDGERLKDKYQVQTLEPKDGTVSQPQQEAIKKIDKDKVKAALEKRRKSRGDVSRKPDFMDEDDLIERELEDGIELAAANEKTTRERKQSWTKPPNVAENENEHHMNHQVEAGDGHHQGIKGQTSRGEDDDNVEEGEVEPFDDTDRRYQSPKNSRKRKAASPQVKSTEGKRHDYISASHNHGHRDYPEDRNKLGRHGYSDADHKRHVQENHV